MKVKLLLGTAVIVLLLLALLGSSSHAQAPVPEAEQVASVETTFTYQGQLKRDGDPVNDTCSFEFRLYDAPSGGNPVGQPITTTVPVQDGLFTVGLDFGNLFDQSRWLGIRVQCPGDAGYVDLGRQPLTAAPRAIYAATTPWDGIQGMPAGFADGVDDDTTYGVGIGLVLTDTTFSLAFPYRLPQGCTGGEIPEWDGSIWACAPDDDSGGDITAVTAGTGLSGGGDSGNVTLNADTAYLQRRVSSICTTGSSIRVINANGTVTCEPDTDTTYAAGNQLFLSGTTFNLQEGSGSDLDADLLDGQESSYYRNASNINAGTLNVARFSAYSDLVDEGYLDDNAGTDLLTRSQANGRYVNEDQGDSVTSAMIVNGTVTADDLQDGAALTEILDDDGAGSGLNADLLDGQHASAFASSSHNHDSRYWKLAGNSGTDPGSDFIGTTDNVALNFRVNNARAFRLEPNTTSPNIIGGYSGNSVTGGVVGATIGGGGASSFVNRVTDNYGTVGGGYYNQAGNNAGSTYDIPYATVCGGENNVASGYGATISGGGYNIASDGAATVGGGYGNTASGYRATIGGGKDNTASGADATIPGGEGNIAAGDHSFAAGYRAQANNAGCFVWGDNTDAYVSCNVNNRTIFRSSGGYYIYTNASLSTGAYLAAGGSSWNSVSDRERKENLRPVDTRALLENLAAIEISTWNYKGQDPSVRHIGPMAQDFNALLPDLGGEGEKYINALDADGVALAAIQGLYGIVREQEAQIESLEAENAALSAQLDDLEARLTALEMRSDGRAASTLQGNLLPGAGVLVLAVGLLWTVRRRGGGR